GFPGSQGLWCIADMVVDSPVISRLKSGAMPSSGLIPDGLVSHQAVLHTICQAKKTSSPEGRREAGGAGEEKGIRNTGFSCGVEGWEQYLVLIKCRDEKQQVELLTRLHGEGLERKALLSWRGCKMVGQQRKGQKGRKGQSRGGISVPGPFLFPLW